MRRAIVYVFTRSAAWLRRWPTHRWLLVVLAFPTLWVLVDLLSDWGPFEGWVQYTTSTVIDRQALAYNELPAYHDRLAAQGGGYFDPYDAYAGSRRHWTDWRFGYHAWEVPHWPDGDPGLGANNPLPPKVIRYEIYAVAPRIALVVLAIGWIPWAALFTRHKLRTRPARGAFEVLVNPPVAREVTT